MRNVFFLITFLGGIALIIIAVFGTMQFRALASASTSADINTYPIVKVVAGDLISQADNRSGGVSPAKLASRIQSRLLAIGGLGLVVIMASLVLPWLRKDDRRPPAHVPEEGLSE